MKNVETSEDFADANENAKLVRAISNLVRRARLDYEGFRRVCAQVRKEVGMRRPPRSRRLPRILSDASLRKFYEVIDRAGNLQHQIMLRLMFYTAVRVSELVLSDAARHLHFLLSVERCGAMVRENRSGDRARY